MNTNNAVKNTTNNNTNEALTRLVEAHKEVERRRIQLRALEKLEQRQCLCSNLDNESCFLCEGFVKALSARAKAEEGLVKALLSRGGAVGWVITPTHGFRHDGTPWGGYRLVPRKDLPQDLDEIVREISKLTELTDPEIRQYRFIGGAQLRSTRRINRYGYCEQQEVLV